MTNIDKWRQLIADRETSGLTVKEWCARNSISKDSYYYWFKKVRNSDSGKADSQILFAEIQKETPASFLCSSCSVNGVRARQGIDTPLFLR